MQICIRNFIFFTSQWLKITPKSLILKTLNFRAKNQIGKKSILARKFKFFNEYFWHKNSNETFLGRFSNTVFLWEKMGKLIPIFFLLNFLLGKTWFSNFLAHEILFGFQISSGGFDIFSGRTLLNWQARFFDHFFIPRAHEFSNGIRSVGKVRIKGVWKKNHPMDHNFKPKIEIPIFITYFHKRKKQDRHHSV